MAALQPDAPALRVPDGEGGYSVVSYAELDEDTNRIARGLLHAGVAKGTRVALFVTPGRDLFAIVFALFRSGAVPVLIDPGMGARAVSECIERAAPEAFVGIPRVHVARVLCGWGRNTVRLAVWVGTRLAPGGRSLDSLRRAGERDVALPNVDAEDTAAIVFTSGSTGPAKGAIYSHGNFAAQVQMLRSEFGIRPGEIDLPTFPLFALFDPALGMTTIVPRMDFTRPGRVDPDAILGPIETFGVTNMFGSPALVKRIVEAAPPARRLRSLRRVITAGAPVTAELLRGLRPLLRDDAEVFTPYGATEALPVCAIESRVVLGETAERTARGDGVCVGTVVAPNRVEVIAIHDRPIETWEDSLALGPRQVGEVVARGPTVTRRYLETVGERDPAGHTARAKIPDGDAVWHRMGDVGWFDEQRRLWYCGRKAHRVQTPRGTVFTMPVERSLGDVGYRTALVGVGVGDEVVPVVCVETSPGVPFSDARRRVLQRARERQPHLRLTAAHVLHHEGFPVDPRHNAKIRRELLGPWAARRLRVHGVSAG